MKFYWRGMLVKSRLSKIDHRSSIIFLLNCYIVLLLSVNVYGQNKTPILERNITLKSTNEKLGVTLNRISQQGGFTFSYNTAIIDVNRIVNLSVTDKSVREVLNILFKGKIEYKVRGNYLILQKSTEADEETDKPVKNETFIVTGYVVNAQGEKISWASIYDKKSLTSTVSDGYGFYKLTLMREHVPVTLNVSKQGYLDTAIELKSGANQFINVTISKKQEPVIVNTSKADTVKKEIPKEKVAEEEVLLPSLMSSENKANTKNITDTIYHFSQISLVPTVGSNGMLGPNVINRVSFNVIGGYSLGTQELELAGVFSVDRGDVQYCQLAGFANAVGGNMKGCQMAGFSNTVRKNVSGYQSAGFANIVGGNQRGVQMAGFSNIVKGKVKGVQLAGFANTVVDSADAAQLAGFSNIAGNLEGTQIAGFTNVADSTAGSQWAGFSNTVYGNLKGSQVAGFANITTKELKGAQLSGFFNYAKKVDGTQIGFFNYTDTVTGGVPFGFLSYVNKGYHKIEISTDEVFPLNIAFRTGTQSLHNILTTGIQPSNDSLLLWTFGYGLGTTFKVSRTVAIDIDLTSNQIQKGSIEAINLNNKLYIGTDIQFAKKFSLAVGGTLNGQIFKTSRTDYPEIFNGYEPNIIHTENFNSNLTMKMWIGGKIALRFL